MAPRSESPEDWPWQVNYGEIQQRVRHLFDSPEWTDCTFVFPADSEAEAGVSSKTLKAHKLFLAMTSPVFAAMFYGNVGNTESPVIIKDIDLTTFSTLLQYIYTDDLCIGTVEDAITIYKAANKYILVPLEEICVGSLMDDMNPDNVCQIYEFACFFGEEELEEKCLEMISTKTQFVLKGSSFLNADANTLKKIVSMDTLDINSEIDLFNALIHYADNFENQDKNQYAAIESNYNKNQYITEHGYHDKQHNNCGTMDFASHSSPKSPSEARQILKDAIEQIRFLSIPPADLSDIFCSCTILSDKEKLSLLTNVSSPNRSPPMPDGFSSIREPRIRGSATFRHTVHNVSRLIPNKDRDVSQICYVRKLPWTFESARELRCFEPCLILYLVTNVDNVPKVSEWSCKVIGELQIISYDPDTYPHIIKFEHTFCKTEKSYEFCCIDWDKLCSEPELKFIKDDSITVELHFTAQPTQGVDFNLL